MSQPEDSPLNITSLPTELVNQILLNFNYLELSEVSQVYSTWRDMSRKNSLWENLYKERWLTNDVLMLDRNWRTVFRDRHEVEMTYLKDKNEELNKLEQKLPKNLKNEKFVKFGELLKENIEQVKPEDKVKAMLVANEQYASSVAVNRDNYLVYFYWAHLLSNLAKHLFNNKNCNLSSQISDNIFLLCFQKYEIASKLESNTLKEDTLCRWGDALHDYAKTKKTQQEVEEWLHESYEKYKKSVNTSPNYIAYDYWGLTLYTHAKLRKRDVVESDKLYEEAAEKYSKAHSLKPEDGYILCHWASTLQNQASQKEISEARSIYREAFSKFSQSFALLPDDAFTCRSWGDALHDFGKKLIQEAESNEVSEDERAEMLDEARDLLDQASQKFNNAVTLRKDYTNAMNNWGLCLSSCAKILDIAPSEIKFSEANSKFSEALNMTSTDQSFIICNWAMTMVSQARKRIQNGMDGSDLLKQAKEKLLTQIEKGDTWGLFCMARWCSVTDDFESCHEWLLKFQASDNYLPRATQGQMSYFKNVAHFDWFQEIINKAKEDSKDIIDFS